MSRGGKKGEGERTRQLLKGQDVGRARVNQARGGKTRHCPVLKKKRMEEAYLTKAAKEGEGEPKC